MRTAPTLILRISAVSIHARMARPGQDLTARAQARFKSGMPHSYDIVLQRNLCHPDNLKNPVRLPLIVRDVPDLREQQHLLQCGEIQVAWNT